MRRLTTDGYETLVFDGAAGVGDDVDLAWVRVNAGLDATVQIRLQEIIPQELVHAGCLCGCRAEECRQARLC